MKLHFEWDDEKAKANFKKHRVGFDEATTVLPIPFQLPSPTPGTQQRNSVTLTLGIPTRDVCW
jgi:uncharacterized DUF497 family protein